MIRRLLTFFFQKGQQQNVKDSANITKKTNYKAILNPKILYFLKLVRYGKWKTNFIISFRLDLMNHTKILNMAKNIFLSSN